MNRFAVAVVFGVIVPALALVAWFGPTRNEKLVAAILARGYCSDTLKPEVEAALSLFLAETEYANRWQINRPPRPNWVNVYILRAGIDTGDRWLPGGAQRLLRNCAYIGYPQLIVIDAGFIDEFLAARSTLIRHPTREVQRSALVHWVLGHELGHLLSGHEPRHFEQAALGRERSPEHYWDGAQLSDDHQREVEADTFCLRRLRTDPGREQQVVSLLYALLNSEIYGKVGEVPTGVGILFDYKNEKVVECFGSGTHPEHVIRLAIMIRLSSILDQDPGTVRMVDGFWKTLRSGGGKTAVPSQQVNLVCHVRYRGVNVGGAKVVLHSVGGRGGSPVSETTDFNGNATFRGISRDCDYAAVATCGDLSHLGYPNGVTYSGESNVKISIPKTFNYQRCEISLRPVSALINPSGGTGRSPTGTPGW